MVSIHDRKSVGTTAQRRYVESRPVRKPDSDAGIYTAGAAFFSFLRFA